MEKPARRSGVEIHPGTKRGQDIVHEPPFIAHIARVVGRHPGDALAFGELDERARQRRIGPPGMMELYLDREVLTEDGAPRRKMTSGCRQIAVADAGGERARCRTRERVQSSTPADDIRPPDTRPSP
jgi:hypothetical protein